MKHKFGEPFIIGKKEVLPGERKLIKLFISRLHDFTELKMPIEVIYGKEPGPILFLAGALHGDEINGVEIIRRLLQHSALKSLKGILIAVPIVNVFGFNNKSRYLPDRRDLNRSFPGSKNGSLAARLAHVFMKEIVVRSTHGIDLHTGAIHRTNLPQIRACLDRKDAKALAFAFGTPIIIDGIMPEGSLRKAAIKKDVPVLVYEGGEALHFDDHAIRMGVRGILSVMRHLGMTTESRKKRKEKIKSLVAKNSFWVRAPKGGILHAHASLGQSIKKGARLGIISDPFGERTTNVLSAHSGIVIGMSRIPLANRGDALFHIATFESLKRAESSIEQYDNFIDLPTLGPS